MLADYLLDYIDEFKTILNWTTVPGSVTTETLLAYGVNSEGDVTDVDYFYNLGKVELWKEALRVGELDKLTYDIIKDNLINAEKAVSQSQITISYKRPTQNPYQSDFSE